MDFIGTLPDWLAAVAAVVALLFARHANKSSREMLSLEQTREGKRDQREIAEQAVDISAWVVVWFTDTPQKGSDIKFTKPRDKGVDFARRANGIHIHNASKLPAYEVRVQSTSWKGEPEPEVVMEVLPPGDYLVFPCNTTVDRLPDPEQPHWTFAQKAELFSGELRPVTSTKDWMVQSVQFTDASGVRWERRRDGTLSQVIS